MITFTIFLSIILLPWWFYLALLLLAEIIIPNYWPAILLGFLIDILYGQGILTGLVAFLILIILIPVRERVRFYA